MTVKQLQMFLIFGRTIGKQCNKETWQKNISIKHNEDIQIKEFNNFNAGKVSKSTIHITCFEYKLFYILQLVIKSIKHIPHYVVHVYISHFADIKENSLTFYHHIFVERLSIANPFEKEKKSTRCFVVYNTKFFVLNNIGNIINRKYSL